MIALPPENTEIRYAIFSNSSTHEGRTKMLEAWPGLKAGTPIWSLYRKSRQHHDDVWGPPETSVTFRLDVFDLIRLAELEGFVHAEYVE